MNQPTIQLNENITIPQIGLGTWQLTGREGKVAIKQALDLGYRHIDTAYHYNNHEAVGRAIAESDVDRSKVFVTTKIWRDHLTESKLNQQFEESLEQLGMDYVDLLLVHWPNEDVPIQETLEAIRALQQEGRVKALGVSNFTTDLLGEALATDVEIVVNQVEYHPTLVQQNLKRFCDDNDITLTAYSPFGHDGRDLELEPIKRIAENKEVTAATVVVRWLVEQGIVAIPKSAKASHQKQNLQAQDITLSDEEIEVISNCGQGNRIIAPDYGPFSAESKR